MSGIAGIYNLTGQHTDGVLIERMANAMGYFGADRVSTFLSEDIGLVSCQLNTTEESLIEEQPIADERSTLWIVCDGRVDNRKELLPQLTEVASCAGSISDAQLILYTYKQWGKECLQKLVGDFVFTLWDVRARQLFCASSPLSLRPFFYYFDGKRFLWASGIKPLLEDDIIPRKIDEEYIARFLIHGHVNWSSTPYYAIKRLRRGEYLIVSANGFQLQQYWTWTPQEIRFNSDEEYEEHFLSLFQNAVRCRLRSTGPVGIMLSGGLDSSSVACIAVKMAQEGKIRNSIEVFTSVYDELIECDERSFAEEIVRKYNLPVHYVKSDNLGLLKGKLEYSCSYDEPGRGLFEERALARFEKVYERGIRVVLTGEGADEVLVGNLYYLGDLFRRFQLRKLFKEFKQWAHPNLSFGSLLVNYCLKPALYPINIWHPLSMGIPKWIPSAFVQRMQMRDKFLEIFPPRNGFSLASWFDYCIIFSLPSYFPGNQWLASPLFIDVRNPYLDQRLVQFLLSIPGEQKHRVGVTKSLSRRAMYGILPDSIRMRQDTVDLNKLIFRWLSQEWVALERIFSNPLVSEYGYVDKKEFMKVLDLCRQGDLSQWRFAWLVICLEIWLRSSQGLIEV